MTLPKDLRDKAEIEADAKAAAGEGLIDPTKYYAFMAGVEWFFEDVEPKIIELEAKLKAAEEQLAVFKGKTFD